MTRRRKPRTAFALAKGAEEGERLWSAWMCCSTCRRRCQGRRRPVTVTRPDYVFEADCPAVDALASRVNTQ